ncbi:hypothetical protein B0I33_102277 [Prauserella shujinwangii]|uniref:Uncharacterized protein n=1 Tax=Prauserella shujinwangii TaxID=1453103 RepID=A0A2T0M0P7_9PSEU|nr:hypothetical protein B0I33_102277 [Prauserella shujinwangii]
MIGSPAFAGGGHHDGDKWGHGGHPGTGQIGLVNVNDVLNDNNVGVCDNKVNVLGVQATDALNGIGLPLLSPGAPTSAANKAPDVCVVESGH